MHSRASYNDKYYEQSELWGREPKSADKERIQTIISFIPEGVNSILDVGCGDGALTNLLASTYEKVVGIDKSNEALKHVKAEKISGSIDYMPFPDNGFDLVVCSEVLEHLPQGIYKQAILELQRVSNKYIIISVPNDEPIEQEFVKCDECGCVFNASRHLRSFNEEKIQTLLETCRIQKYVFCGTLREDYNKLLLDMKRLFGGGWENPTNALCPQCGSKNTYKSRRNIFTLTIGFLNRIIAHKKRKRWIVALYRK